MILMLAVLMTVANDAPQISNGRFEQSVKTSGLPSSWLFTSLPSKHHLVTYRTKVVGEGDQASNALEIHVAGDHPDESVAYNAHQELKGLAVGKTYRVSAKMTASGLSTAPMIVLECLNANGDKHLGFARSEERRLSGDVTAWERFETDITVPEGTAVVRLRVGIPAKGNAGGTAVIDDVEIAEVN
ncbi:hypothetical protein [Rosistilla oblonga]|uniref:hypothetical protein n=1 Tax=Rosistilla oblonga TaxID=2527990 RepID=UPI003A97848B